MTKIEFQLWGLTLLEPMALILNTLLAGTCIYLYFSLKNEPRSKFIKYWRAFFIAFGISTFFGGLSHVFYNYWGLMGKIPNWFAAVISVSMLEMAMISYFKSKYQKGLTAIVLVKASLVFLIFLVDFSFDWVIVHTAIGFFLFLGIPSLTLFAKGKTEFRYFGLSFIFMLMTLPIKLGGYDLHLWFNRDDFSHVLMFFTLFAFSAGAKEIEQRQESMILQKA